MITTEIDTTSGLETGPIPIQGSARASLASVMDYLGGEKINLISIALPNICLKKSFHKRRSIG